MHKTGNSCNVVYENGVRGVVHP